MEVQQSVQAGLFLDCIGQEREVTLWLPLLCIKTWWSGWAPWLDLGRDILSEVIGLDMEGDGLACHCFHTHLSVSWCLLM